MPNTAPTVLVVDDDPDVLLVASTMLEDAGYTVLEAESGVQAMQVLAEHPEIDLLFTDVVMPGGVNGFELAYQAKQLRPELRIVYTSGYVKELPAGPTGVRYGPMIPKPWRRNQMLITISSLLNGSGGASQ
jgi:CheY-like chemotaxis protein